MIEVILMILILLFIFSRENSDRRELLEAGLQTIIPQTKIVELLYPILKNYVDENFECDSFKGCIERSEQFIKEDSLEKIKELFQDQNISIRSFKKQLREIITDELKEKISSIRNLNYKDLLNKDNLTELISKILGRKIDPSEIEGLDHFLKIVRKTELEELEEKNIPKSHKLSEEITEGSEIGEGKESDEYSPQILQGIPIGIRQPSRSEPKSRPTTVGGRFNKKRSKRKPRKSRKTRKSKKRN